MTKGIWSSSIMRTFILIAGAIVVLEATHVLAISITFHAVAQDLRSEHTIAGIAAGFGVSMLAVMPDRKGRSVQRKRMIPAYPANPTKPWERAQHLRVIAESLAKHSDIR